MIVASWLACCVSLLSPTQSSPLLSEPMICHYDFCTCRTCGVRFWTTVSVSTPEPEAGLHHGKGHDRQWNSISDGAYTDELA